MVDLVLGEFLLGLLLMILIGLINIPIAKSKGRSLVRWFFLGFLLGPIGFILMLFMPKTRAKKDEEALARGELKKCPSCAELIKSEAVKCPYCGDILDVDEPLQYTLENLQ